MTFEKLLSEKLDIQYLYLYKYALKASRRYKVYQIKKRTGGMRTIHHPAVELKVYQRFLVQNIFSSFPVHNKVFSYKENTSIRDLALLHVNNRFLLRIDFKDFFPSIKSENIRDFLKNNHHKLECNLTEKDITIINMLVCRKKELTIGAPSSPILSNILLYDFDLVLNKMFGDSIVYSRYADDLYFSTNVPNILTNIPRQIEEFLLTYYIKLKINHDKTIFTSKKHKRVITGLTITTDNTISIGREKKQYIKGLMYKFKNKQIQESDLIYLKGYLSFIKSVDMTFFNLLEKKYGMDILYS